MKDTIDSIYEMVDRKNHEEAARLGMTYEDFMKMLIREKHGEDFGNAIIDCIEGVKCKQ